MTIFVKSSMLDVWQVFEYPLCMINKIVSYGSRFILSWFSLHQVASTVHPFYFAQCFQGVWKWNIGLKRVSFFIHCVEPFAVGLLFFIFCLYYFDNFKAILKVQNYKEKQVHFLNQFSEKNLFQCLHCHSYRHFSLVGVFFRMSQIVILGCLLNKLILL